MNTKEKSDKFLKILECLHYDKLESLSAHRLDFLFDMEETKSFFDWFLDNVDEDCYLSEQELNEFRLKMANGEVCWDLDKLEQINNLTNLQTDDQTTNLVASNVANGLDDEESLRRDNEIKQGLLEHLLEQQKQADFYLDKYTTMYMELNKKEQQNVKTSQGLDSKIGAFDTEVKFLNQQFEKAISEFQIHFNEENLIKCLMDESNCTDEQTTNFHCVNYANLERALLEKMAGMLYTEPLEPATESEHQTAATSYFAAKMDELKCIMKNRSKSSLHKWLDAKLSYEFARESIEEIKKILENFDKLLVNYTQDKLNANPTAREKMRLVIKDNIQISKSYEKSKKKVSDQLQLKMSALATDKLVKLGLIETDRKLINLNLFRYKQDKVLKHLHMQRTRIDFNDFVLNLKINNLKTLTSMVDGFLNDSANSFPLKVFESNIEPSMQNDAQQHHEAQIHLLNQFLISILTKFQNDDDQLIQNDDKFELDNRISTNFNDNLDSLVSLSNRIVECMSSSDKHRQKKLATDIYKSIWNALEHVYEKNDPLDGASNESTGGRLNFKRFTLNQIKVVDELLAELKAKTHNLECQFTMRIYSTLKAHRTELNDNKLYRLRRDFFVNFFTNPRQIDVILEHLNSIV